VDVSVATARWESRTVLTVAFRRSDAVHRSENGSSLVDRACQLMVFVVYPISRARFVLRPYTNHGTDLDFYFGYVQRAANGDVPYRDFAVEYPPAAWLLMRAPGTTDWVAYVHRFAWIATALEVAAFALFLAIAWQLSPRRFWLVAATYVVTTTFLREFLPTRLDGGLLFLLMLWSWWTLVPGQAGMTATRTLAYGVLGFATSYKLAPVLMLPFALAHHSRRARGGELWILLLSFAVGAAVPFILVWPASGAASFGFLTYHIERGLEIESVWATLLWPARWFGQPLSAAHVENTIELIGPATGMLSQLSGAVALGATAWCLAAETARPWRGSAVVVGALGLAVFVVLSKVLSPQYFVWLLPLLAVAGTEALESDRVHRWWCAGLVGVAALTTLIYPRFFLAVIEMRPLGFLLLFSRNALLVALIASLARHVWKK
jgi:hypothetical protein